MRLRGLRAFRYVMEEGTIAAAATRLNLSQPAVSRLISGLEKELGVSFFLRMGPRLIPTETGERLFEEIQGLLSAIDHLPSLATSIRDAQHKKLRILTMPRLAKSVALPVISMLQREAPDLRCELLVLDRVETEAWIREGDFDVGFAVLPLNNRAVDVIRIGTSPIYVLTRSDHHLSGLESVEFSKLLNERIVALPAGTRDRLDMEALFYNHSGKPNICAVVPTAEDAATLVSTGIGITFSEEISISGISHLDISAIKLNPTWYMTFGVFYPSYKRLSYEMKRLIYLMEEHLGSISLPSINRLSSKN